MLLLDIGLVVATTILAWLRGGIADIYVQKKLDQMEDKENFQDLNDFNREIKMFSNKSKIANTE